MRKRMMILMLAGILGTMPAVPAMADAAGTSAAQSSETNSETSQTEKSFISFGKDLSSSQKQKVLDLFGISESDLADMNTITISNSDEHKYLDDYLPAKTIGTRALSSVYVKPAASGSGIQVTTKNITYCTAGMYENAMTTAGLKDVNVIVAGPSPISGTAALVGAAEAYSKMTGTKVDEDKVDAAVDEIVTTGEIEQNQDEDNPNYTASAGNEEESDSNSSSENTSGSTSSDASSDSSDGSTSDQSVESLLADLKQKVASGEIKKSQIEDAVRDEAEDHDVSLSDEDVQKITDLLEKLSKLDLDVNALSSQASSLSEKLENLTKNQSTDSQNTANLFQKIGQFFSNLAKRLHLSN